ncbi:MAG: DNA-binding protein [Deltaproteobacteria bacterium]|nr:DNA-binding protein [Deltaproteobacteria bacterium]
MSATFPSPTTQGFDSLPSSAMIPAKVVAQVLGVSASTVWRMVASGQLTPVRVGERNTRFRVADIRRIAGQE